MPKFTAIKDEFKPLAAGDYEAILSEIHEGLRTKPKYDGDIGEPMMRFVWELKNGRKISDYLMPQHSDPETARIALSKLSRMAWAILGISEGQEYDTKDFHLKECVLTLKVDGDFNRIVKFSKIGTNNSQTQSSSQKSNPNEDPFNDNIPFG